MRALLRKIFKAFYLNSQAIDNCRFDKCYDEGFDDFYDDPKFADYYVWNLGKNLPFLFVSSVYNYAEKRIIIFK